MTPSSSPVPRLMACSMVSSGTEASRAFWYMVRSVGFMSGSPPPSRAATSTWRISLAKSLARLASVAPFLCLIVAHLEWPDMRSPRRVVVGRRMRRRLDVRRCRAAEEQLVEPAVAGELGMERRRPAPGPGGTAPGGRRPRPAPRRPSPDLLDERGPDEHGVERRRRGRRRRGRPRTSRPGGRRRCGAR